MVTFVSNAAFSTGTQLLTILNTALLTESWASLANNPGINIDLAGQSFGDSCYLRAIIVSRPNSEEALELIGSIDATYAALSPALATDITNTSTYKSLLDLRYVPGGANSVWITASEDAFVIAIKHSTNTNVSAWRFGFYDRLRQDLDEFGWGLGPIHFGLGHDYVARSWASNTPWYYLASAFSQYMASDAYNLANNAYQYNRSSADSQSLKPFMNPFSQNCLANRTGRATNNSFNPTGNFYIGNTNGLDSSIKPFPFWVQETETLAIPNTENSPPIQSVFRGLIKYVATGFGHLANGTIVVVNSTQYLVISRGCTSAIVIG